MTSNQANTIIIGGGLAGLLAANELADAGRPVILLEKASRAGGRAQSTVKSGAVLNFGGHALYRGGELDRMLQRFGIRPSGGSPAASGFAIWRGALAALPGDPLKLAASRLLSWPGKLELARFMMRLRRIEGDAIPRVSLREWAEAEIREPMVRHLLYALNRTATYSTDIDSQLAGASLRQLRQALTSGVLYVDGGWQTIVDRLRQRAAHAGADIRIDSPAAAILHDSGRIAGVRLADGSRLNASRVIAAVPPAETLRLLQDADIPSLRRWRDEALPATAACLDLILKRLPVRNRHFAIGLDQPVYVSNHSSVANLSDNGTIVIHAMKYNGSAATDPEADLRQLEQTMDLMQPGWRQESVARQFLPRMTVVHDQPHLGRTGPQPGPDVPELPGLYVAGDWSGHGEMLADAAAASARRAAVRLVQQAERR